MADATYVRDGLVPTLGRAGGAGGVVALSGYNVRIQVEHGHLAVEEGPAESRHCARYTRASSGLKRLVILSRYGSVTLDAMRWLHDVGAAFVHIDPAGDLIATGLTPAVRDTRVRRGQALASMNGAGLTVARQLIGAKIEGQAAVLRQMTGQSVIADHLGRLTPTVEQADSIGRIRYIESRAAAPYWDAWSDLPIRFVSRDVKRLPAHWRTFGERRSTLSASSRRAINPANALLNYGYALLEAEARLALIAVGCDLGLSVIHAEQASRDSFALDLMEPVRPHVDAFVVNLLTTRVFSRSDFFEMRDGTCRLMPTLARPLAATCREWARLLAPVAEHVAGIFARSGRPGALPGAASSHPLPDRDEPVSDRLLRTPLTGRNRSRAGRRERIGAGLRAPLPRTYLPAQCKQCGATLPASARTYCDICLAAAPQPARKATQTIRERRKAAGVADGRSSASARIKHRRDAVLSYEERVRWEASTDVVPSKGVFEREIRPALHEWEARAIADATGLTLGAAKAIRRGRFTPHPRHWDALRRLIARPPKREPWQDLDEAFFDRQIAPALATLTAEGIHRATGLSLSYARRVIARHHVPHCCHWPALRTLVERGGRATKI